MTKTPSKATEAGRLHSAVYYTACHPCVVNESPPEAATDSVLGCEYFPQKPGAVLSVWLRLFDFISTVVVSQSVSSKRSPDRLHTRFAIFSDLRLITVFLTGCWYAYSVQDILDEEIGGRFRIPRIAFADPERQFPGPPVIGQHTWMRRESEGSLLRVADLIRFTR